jgi:hypothetical protein
VLAHNTIFEEYFMGMVAIVIALINRIAACFDAVNKKIFDGKLSKWLVLGIESLVAKLPLWWQQLKAMHRSHFRIMDKYNPRSKKREQMTNRVGAVVYAYLSANMYFVSAIFFVLTWSSIYLEFSMITLLGGLLCAWFYFKFGEIYRADAYNNARKGKIKLVPWKRKKP